MNSLTLLTFVVCFTVVISAPTNNKIIQSSSNIQEGNKEVISEPALNENSQVYTCGGYLTNGGDSISETSNSQTASRKKRFSVMKQSWHHLDLTYRIGDYGRSVSRSDQDYAVKTALKAWTDYVKITFRKVDSNAESDFNFRFVTGYHGDNYRFTGSRNNVGHAFQPESGKVHIDDSINWRVRGPRSFKANLVAVLAHEIGHALGLHHSTHYFAIMNPVVKDNFPVKLTQDDIDGIQTKYPARSAIQWTKKSTRATTTTTPVPTTTTTTHTPTTTKIHAPVDICKDASFDAVMINTQDKIYAFKGEYFYIINGKYPNQALPIRTHFRGVPNNLDAVISFSDEIYFFKKDLVYRVRNNRLELGYPKKISQVFRGAPDNINSAFIYMDAVYIIKNGQFYMASMIAGRIYTHFTKTSSPFVNTPSRIDGVFTWPGVYTELFSGTRYLQAESGSKKFTKVRSTAMYWFYC